MALVIEDFPLSPSVNKLLGNNRGRGKKGRYKTKEYKAFEDQVLIWSLANKRLIKIYSEKIHSWIESGYYLKVDCEFRFKKHRIWTKDNKPQQLDSSNYIKALHDQLSGVIHVDDRYFWRGTFDKYPAERGKECTRITIAKYFPSLPRDLRDL